MILPCESGYNLFDGKLIDMNGRLIKAWRSRYLSLLLPDGRYLPKNIMSHADGDFTAGMIRSSGKRTSPFTTTLW